MCAAFAVDQVRTARLEQAHVACTENLRRLGELWISEGVHQQGPKYNGQSYFLSWRKKGVIEPGSESILRCPLDESTVGDSAEESALYDQVHLADPRDDLCSYAVRHFRRAPLDPEDPSPQPLAACLHHRAARHVELIVLYDDGSVRWESARNHGFLPDDELTCGPDSPSPVLGTLVYRD